jgi:hypothetical protein
MAAFVYIDITSKTIKAILTPRFLTKFINALVVVDLNKGHKDMGAQIRHNERKI